MARHFANTSGDVVTIGNPAAIQALTSITVACWFCLDATTGARQDFVSKHLQFILHSTGANPPTIGWDINGGAGVTGTRTASVGAWHHTAASLTGTTAKVYLDGALDSTNASSNAMPASNTDTLAFGQDTAFGGSAFVDGRVAEVSIWSRALGDAEVAALAKGVPAPLAAPNGLVGYWPLHGVSTTEPDLSGQRNNGTVTGTTVASPPPVGMLTRPRGDFWAVRAAATIYTQTLNLAQATSPALGKQAGKALSTAQPTSPALAKLAGKRLAASQATSALLGKVAGKFLTQPQPATPALAKQTTKPLSAVQATSPALQALRVQLLLLSLAQATVPALGKAATKGLTLAQPTQAALTKAVGLPLAVAQATSATLGALKVRLLLLSVSQPTSAVLSRTIGKGLAATQATAPRLGKGVGKALAVAQGTLATLLASGGSAVTASVQTLYAQARHFTLVAKARVFSLIARPR